MKMNDLNLVSITKNSINFNESVTENYSLDTYIQASIRSTDKEIIIVFSRESIYGNTHKVRKHYSNRTGKCWVSIKGDAFLELDKLLNLSKSVCKFIPKVHTVDQDSIYIILTRY